MNQWSIPDYAIAVHEALDSWVKSIWNFTNSFSDMTLPIINYDFYVSNINSTSNYDVLISFTSDEISPKTVGMTTYRWNLATHEPIPPIIINITTYSSTADPLFVKNIAMHEFGHALGLGHASSQTTSNGPELMYYSTPRHQIVYPSTLDVYGLIELYEGIFDQEVQLPSNIPYEMLAEGDIPPPPTVQSSPLHILYPSTSDFQYLLTEPQEILYKPMILLVPSILWMSIGLVLGLALCSGKKGALVAFTGSVFIAYYITTWNIKLVSLTLKTVPLLPAILIGASIGEIVSRRFAIKKEKMLE